MAPDVSVTSALPKDDLDRIHQIVGSRWQSLRGQRLFVTGGTGFVGRWLLGSLIDANARFELGCEVAVLTRDPDAVCRTTEWLACASQVTLVKGDVRVFDKIGGGFDHIIHAAADVATLSSPLDTFDTCVQGTRNVLEFAKREQVRSLLLISSGAVYGPQPPELTAVPESYTGGPDVLKRTSGYAEGKRAAEFLACAGGYPGLAVKVARLFAFIGPYLPLDGPFAIGNFLLDALRDRAIVVKGDGTVVRSYLHASDMAAWLWAIWFDGRSGEAYNVGSSEAVSMAALAKVVHDITGSTAGIRVLQNQCFGLASERYVPDVSRARSELQIGTPLDLHASISRTVLWLRANKPEVVLAH